jgi:hypothetical protein
VIAATLDTPRELEDVVAGLLAHHGIPATARTIKRMCELGRPCGCDHPIGLRDEWFPSWCRCLLCGRTVEERER